MRQVLVERLGYGLARYQTLYVHLRSAVRPSAYKPAHHLVAAGVYPVRLGLRVGGRTCVIAIIDHIPRTIYVLAAEAIAVVPLAHIRIVAFQPVILQHFAHFRVGKAEIFIELFIRN